MNAAYGLFIPGERPTPFHSSGHRLAPRLALDALQALHEFDCAWFPCEVISGQLDDLLREAPIRRTVGG